MNSLVAKPVGFALLCAHSFERRAEDLSMEAASGRLCTAPLTCGCCRPVLVRSGWTDPVWAAQGRATGSGRSGLVSLAPRRQRWPRWGIKPPRTAENRIDSRGPAEAEAAASNALHSIRWKPERDHRVRRVPSSSTEESTSSNGLGESPGVEIRSSHECTVFESWLQKSTPSILLARGCLEQLSGLLREVRWEMERE